MDSDSVYHKENKQETIANNDDAAKKASVSSSNSGSDPKGKNHSINVPLKIVIPAIVVVIVFALLLILFLHHPSAVSSVNYTPVTAFTPTALNSYFGGNWSLVDNATVNSSTVAKSPSRFPPGTVSASVQEFITHLKASAVASNLSSNVSIFSAEVFYLNSSLSASSVFKEIIGLVGSQYGNSSKVKFNSSSIGSTKFVYLTGRVNASNSSTTAISETYAINGKDFIIDNMENGNFSYATASKLVLYPFSTLP